MELVDVPDSKSGVGNYVPVRPRPSANKIDSSKRSLFLSLILLRFISKLYSGFVIASAGFASLIAGIPVLCINKDRMRCLVNDYNAGSSAQDLSLNFGPAPSGVGFTLNF